MTSRLMTPSPAQITFLAAARRQAAGELTTARRRHTTTTPILRRIARLTRALLAAEIQAPPRRTRGKAARKPTHAADAAPSLL